jgi:hypothetical protein
LTEWSIGWLFCRSQQGNRRPSMLFEGVGVKEDGRW